MTITKHIKLICGAMGMLLCMAGCSWNGTKGSDAVIEEPIYPENINVRPIEGTWINLAYQDVRNKYTNNISIDYTDPALWTAKVEEMADMGMKYLIFMAVANEGKAYYPSGIMPHTYPDGQQSPVDAIMEAAAAHGLKVFMSTGWAKDQDDNLQDPWIKQRQIEMMEELAGLYGNHPAMYGWYLPVEDCLCPIFSQHAVDAVNALTEKARSLTPGKKILISPYGIVNSAFDRPEFEQQLAKVKVDIIAYQDEIGCVREEFPLVRLRQNWMRLSEIHKRLDIEMWANCETFTWERGTNDRTSALIPAAYQRLLAQQCAASAAGAKTIISFMVPGIIESPESAYQLGQPGGSARAYKEYTAWREGALEWKLLESTFLGKYERTFAGSVAAKIDGYDAPALVDGVFGQETKNDSAWEIMNAGHHEVELSFDEPKDVHTMFVRMLNYNKGGVVPPSKVHLYVAADGENYKLVSIKDLSLNPNNLHDAWIDGVLFNMPSGHVSRVKFAFDTEAVCYMDEVMLF